jgi:hypothetical protein
MTAPLRRFEVLVVERISYHLTIDAATKAEAEAQASALWFEEYGASLAFWERAALVETRLVRTRAQQKGGGAMNETEILMCEARKALVYLDMHLLQSADAAYRPAFDTAYVEALRFPVAAPLPVLMAQTAAGLEAVAAALDLPNDTDGSAEDSFLTLI